MPFEEYYLSTPELSSMSTLQLGPTYEVRACPIPVMTNFTLLLSIRCTGGLRGTRTLPHVHSVSLEVGRGHQKDRIPTAHEQSCLSSLVQSFHSQLSTFPHLREAEIETSRVVHELLAETAGTPPTFGGQLRYQWKIRVSPSSFRRDPWSNFKPNPDLIQTPPSKERDSWF